MGGGGWVVEGGEGKGGEGKGGGWGGVASESGRVVESAEEKVWVKWFVVTGWDSMVMVEYGVMVGVLAGTYRRW